MEEEENQKPRRYIVDRTENKIWDKPTIYIKMTLMFGSKCNNCDVKATCAFTMEWENPDGCPIAGGYGGSFCSEQCAIMAGNKIQPYRTPTKQEDDEIMRLINFIRVKK